MAVLAGCGGDDGGGEGAPEPPQIIPSELTAPAFSAFMAGGDYTENGWVSETDAPRPASTPVSPHGDVRVWFNPTAVESQQAGNGVTSDSPPHLVETMVVKELYDAGALVGHAAFLKVDEGKGPGGWQYYCQGPDGRCFSGASGFTGTPYFAKGNSQCGACHGGFVFTIAP